MAGQRGRSGGRRSGAGRKPKAEKHLTPIQAAERRIADRLPALIDNLFRLADGVMLEKTDKEGCVDFFMTPPDRLANEYLINRVMGKPTDRHEHEIRKLSDEELVERVTIALGRDGPAGAETPAPPGD